MSCACSKLEARSSELPRFQRALGLLREILKCGRVFYCQVRENLAIEFNAGLLQAVDELRIAQGVGLGRGADTHDPQRAVLAFALLAARVGELQSALDGFFGGAVEFRFCKEITAGTV